MQQGTHEFQYAIMTTDANVHHNSLRKTLNRS